MRKMTLSKIDALFDPLTEVNAITWVSIGMALRSKQASVLPTGSR
jgi:hypothetical protein